MNLLKVKKKAIRLYEWLKSIYNSKNYLILKAFNPGK